MRALVVHESMFGNTAAVADAVGAGLATVEGIEVEVVAVRHAPTDVSGVGLVVVGGPTHAFGLSRASTRSDAATKGADAAAARGIGIREWVEGLGPAAGALVATFDTRVRRPRVPGSAARAAAKRLRRSGFELLAPATTFWVDGTPGPLVAGEEDRARAWGVELGAALKARRPS